jgi:hypothetical protein
MWTNWEGIAEYLKLLAAKSNYAAFVGPLLDLIPEFSADPALKGVQPGLAHLTLTLALAGGRRKIHIDLEGPGVYNIYLDHCADNILAGQFYGERITASAGEVRDAVRGYLARLRAEQGASVA